MSAKYLSLEYFPSDSPPSNLPRLISSNAPPSWILPWFSWRERSLENLGICECAKPAVWLFCDLMDRNPPGFSVGGILQSRILKWVAVSSFRRFSWHRYLTHVFCIGRWILYHWVTWEAHLGIVFSLILDSHVPITLYYTYSFSNILLFLLPQVLCTCYDLGRLHCTLKAVSQGFLLILQSSTSLPTCLRSTSLIFSFRFPSGSRLSKHFALFPSWCRAQLLLLIVTPSLAV